MQHELLEKCLLSGPVGAGHAELQHAVSLAEWGWGERSITMALDTSTWWLNRNT